jgi:hypothetical protein
LIASLRPMLLPVGRPRSATILALASRPHAARNAASPLSVMIALWPGARVPIEPMAKVPGTALLSS